MTHILEDLTHKMEGQPPKQQVSWALGKYIYMYIHVNQTYIYIDIMISYSRLYWYLFGCKKDYQKPLSPS